MVEKIPRTYASTALTPPERVDAISTTRSPTLTPRLRARPAPNNTPVGESSASRAPASIVIDVASSASLAGLTPSPENEIVVSPWLASPEK